MERILFKFREDIYFSYLTNAQICSIILLYQHVEFYAQCSQSVFAWLSCPFWRIICACLKPPSPAALAVSSSIQALSHSTEVLRPNCWVEIREQRALGPLTSDRCSRDRNRETRAALSGRGSDSKASSKHFTLMVGGGVGEICFFERPQNHYESWWNSDQA